MLRRARWQRLALVMGASLLGCGSFRAVDPADTGSADAASVDAAGADVATDAAPACSIDSCADAGASCRAYTFPASPCPPADWRFAGDMRPGAVAECVQGRIHVAAANTLDASASLELTTPGTLAVVRVSLRFAVTKWDGKRLFTVGVAGQTAFAVTATEEATGAMGLALCVDASSGPMDCVPLATVPFDVDHLLTLELDATGVAAQLDCGPAVTRPGAAVAPKTALHVGFGHADGDPIDGTLAEAVVSFR